MGTRRSLPVLLLLPLLTADPTPAGAGEVPAQVRALQGTYTGAWTMYGIDATGAVVKNMAWTDTMTADKPEVKDGQAFVSTTDVMTFEGGKIPPFKIQAALSEKLFGRLLRVC